MSSVMSVRDRLVDNRASLFFVIVAMLATLCSAVSAQETASSELPPGWITPTTPGIVKNPRSWKKLASASDNNVGGEPKDGLHAEFGNMITGEGWISAGPGYRRRVLKGAARIDVSAALSWNLYRSLAVAEGVTQTLKYSVRRERPDGNGRNSFPSGHAADTFAFATALGRHLGWRGALTAYIVSSYVAASRLRENRHFLSDVVFGATVGTTAGRTVTRHGREYYADVQFLPGGAALMFVRQRG
jgi:hypothetical protein